MAEARQERSTGLTRGEREPAVAAASEASGTAAGSVTIKSMEMEQHLKSLSEEGARLIDAATQAGLEAPVPTCPGWRVRDLVRHMGGVHHWAHAQITAHRDSEIEGDLEDIVGGWPPDGELIDWAARQHQHLVEAFEAADPDYPYWTWRTPRTTPLAFWVRRQAHETAIHRVDSDRAAGLRLSQFDAALAADGIDELLVDVVGSRRGPAPVETAIDLAFVAEDISRRWWLRVEPDGYTAGEGEYHAAATFFGPASALYQLVWHRLSDNPVRGEGQVQQLEQFYEVVNIRWT